MGAEDNLIRDFQKETNTFLDAEKQLKHEEREKEWNLERQRLSLKLYLKKYINSHIFKVNQNLLISLFHQKVYLKQ